jgi:hypothetical protein
MSQAEATGANDRFTIFVVADDVPIAFPSIYSHNSQHAVLQGVLSDITEFSNRN